MKIVLAALDESFASSPVLTAATALANVLDAEVEAIHVKVDGGATALRTAERAEVPLRVVTGDVVERLVEAGAADEVAALVIGARGVPTDPRPLGATAEAVATRVARPVLVVPPDAAPPAVLRRILVPIEGAASSRSPRAVIELAEGANVEVIALHVLAADEIPPFTDQPQHEHSAWATEFIARYCPWGVGSVQLEIRIGRAEELVPRVAAESRCDLIALGWAQELAPGRAPVVRAALERSHRPVMLVPVRVARDPETSRVGATSAGGAFR
jgi:universal stress protein family protein